MGWRDRPYNQEMAKQREAQVTEAVEMYVVQKLSIRAIAKAMGMSYGTTYNRLRAGGVTFRSRAEVAELRKRRRKLT